MFFASNGAERLEAAANEKSGVILPDAIMLTAKAGKASVLKIAKMGVRDSLVRPFTEANVIDRVSLPVDSMHNGNAKHTGFIGSIIKPINLEELPDSLFRAMNLNNTPLFSSRDEDTPIVFMSGDLSAIGSHDLVRYSRGRLSGLVNSGHNTLIIDLTGVKKFEIPLLRAIACILIEAKALDIAWRIVGSDDGGFTLPTLLASDQKVSAFKDVKNPFEGRTTIDIYPNRDATKDSF